jgi:hypothetical protein
MISLYDLGLAYRKAKVDLYYSSDPPLKSIANYEENLLINLETLLTKINGKDESWVTNPDLIGDWTVAPKSVDMSSWEEHKKQSGNGLVFSSPLDEWKYACAQLTKKNKPKSKAEFRVMAQCSIDFHVLSTLWMLKVGEKIDAMVTSNAYGNRIRREKNGKDINSYSHGSFNPYLKPYRDWRNNGLEVMRTALNKGKKIVVLTADVNSFYHKLDPGFLLDNSFISNVLGLQLNGYAIKLNRLFVTALQAWAATTPLKNGLPVGLAASSIVANASMIELDRIIEQQCTPLYYGRYVDDIILVIENTADFRTTDDLWNWLIVRSDGKLDWENGTPVEKIVFKPKYLKNSQVYFANDKNKVFILDGESGKNLVEAIAHQIHKRASEWRAMPALPNSASQVGTDLLSATQHDGEPADNLRKMDALTLRRAGFAIKLRDYEAYERDLEPVTWQEHRRAFFRAFVQHVLVLPTFFDQAVYLRRIIRLATACEDFESLRDIIERLKDLYTQVKDTCEISLKAYDNNANPVASDVIERWKKQLYDIVCESISSAFPPRLSKAGKQAWQEHMTKLSWISDSGIPFIFPLLIKQIQGEQIRLFSFDLAHMPFRFIGLPSEMVTQRGIPIRKTVKCLNKADTLLPNDIIKGIEVLGGWIRFKNLPNGLLFATRPYNLLELFIVNNSAYDILKRDDMNAAVYATRGFKLAKAAPFIDKNNVLHIQDNQPQSRHRIAVSSWKTETASWTASVTRRPDPDNQRYSRLCRLLNDIIEQPQQCRYLVLPELALPAHWFIRLARKLQHRRISLISGIEYLHSRKARVRNQVWAALSHDGLGFPSLMIYRQDKQHPALHEEQELQRLAGLKMRPEPIRKFPLVIQHGDLRFALLVCSELTNISYRAALRGKIDALFIPEWNTDTETFNALVESAALDIHAYIIQCNDRQYGDSRIRAPFKESWQRDILRVKGGVTDYCVIGEIDIQALRRFQSSHRSPAKPFKPVPDGFNEAMDYDRKVLPTDDKD